VTTRRGCKEDINGNNEEESVKMKRPKMRNKKAYK